MAYGALAALDDRPRPGKEPTITPEAKAWLVSLACDKAKEHAIRMNCGRHGFWPAMRASADQCLARLAQGTVCKLLGQEEIKPHKVRYYLKRRDAGMPEPKMAEVLCVYREVQVLKKAAAKAEKSKKPVAIVSYDEKPGIQAIATTAPDLPPVPGRHASFARDHEYKRHGTLSLLAGIDLLTGKVHALVRERHRSREFIEFPQASRCRLSGQHRDAGGYVCRKSQPFLRYIYCLEGSNCLSGRLHQAPVVAVAALRPARPPKAVRRSTQVSS